MFPCLHLSKHAGETEGCRLEDVSADAGWRSQGAAVCCSEGFVLLFTRCFGGVDIVGSFLYGPLIRALELSILARFGVPWPDEMGAFWMYVGMTGAP